MNRRNLVKLALGATVASLPTGTLAESTPDATPDIPDMNRHLYSPEAASVHAMTFRANQTDLEDTIRFHYTVFLFQSDESATENFDEVSERIDALRADDDDFASEWNREVDIGAIGNDRIGYLEKDDARLNGIAVAGEIMVAFEIVTPDPVAAYESVIQQVLEESPSLDLDLGDFPPGWRYEIEPREVTEYFQ